MHNRLSTAAGFPSPLTLITILIMISLALLGVAIFLCSLPSPAAEIWAVPGCYPPEPGPGLLLEAVWRLALLGTETVFPCHSCPPTCSCPRTSAMPGSCTSSVLKPVQGLATAANQGARGWRRFEKSPSREEGDSTVFHHALLQL